MTSHEIIYVIVAKNKGTKILKEAKKLGVHRGTIIKSKGTIRSKLLNFLAFYDIDKEIVIMGTDYETSQRVSRQLAENLNLNKKSQGILFTIGVDMYMDNDGYVESVKKEENNTMYKLITTIVNLGSAQDVIDIAYEAGATGATILHGRGSGIEEPLKLFNMEIEPEKEIIMVIAKDEEYENIVHSLNENMQLEKPGKGILFVQNINQAFGLYEGE